MPFRGYFPRGDPRHQFWGSGGADWPTVPPYRWRLGSEDATGVWGFLKTTGVLLEPWEAVTYQTARWQATKDKPECLQYIQLTRQWFPFFQNIRWYLTIKADCETFAWEMDWAVPKGPANVTLDIGYHDWDQGPAGTSGEKLKAYQVLYDQETVPGGWPPW